MSRTSLVVCLVLLFGVAAFLPSFPAHAVELVYAKDGSGVYGYKDTPILPWCGYRVHDPDRPAPKRITPGLPGRGETAGSAPSDAIVLFGGNDLSKWQPSEWKVVDGVLESQGSDPLVTKDPFGDIQLHLEWRTPDPPQGNPFDRGNNGVLLMGRFEIQIFDSYTEKIYPDGQAASVYGQTPPLVNACRKPGEWQTYDIIFTAPLFKDGSLAKPARVTVLHNGVLVHLDQEIKGEMKHRELPTYTPIPEKLPLMLGAHNNPVRFRNIWVRPL